MTVPGISPCTWLPAMPTVQCLALSSLSVAAKKLQSHSFVYWFEEISEGL